MSARLNHLAIFVSAIAFFLLSWLWYALIFGKVYQNWTSSMGHSSAMANSTMTTPLIVTFLMGWLLAYVIGVALNRAADPNPVSRGIGFGIFMGLGVYGTMTLMGSVWSQGGFPLSIWAINTGFVVVAMAIMGAIIGAWSKRAVA